jgi:kumamolisin
MPHPDVFHVVLPGSERSQRKGSVVMRPCEPQEMCDITVKVRRKANLPEPDPARPISKAELAAKYGADPGDLATVEKVLTSFGMTVKAKNETTHSIEFVGPVSAMEAAFQVKLSWVRHKVRVSPVDQPLREKEFNYRGRTGMLHVPQSLDGIVTGIFGLDTRPMIKHHRHNMTRATTALPPPDSRPWFIPQELAQAYKFPDGDGSGQSIAILEFGGKFLPDDLNSFLQQVGLPNESPDVEVRNIRPIAPQDADDPDATGEVMLDIEVVAALCPKAAIVVLFSQFTEDGWVANLDAIVSDPTSPTIVSVSYGLAEGTDVWQPAAMDAVNDALKALANAGITVCVSSGDDGSDDQTGSDQAQLDFPASSPWVLAVGGTALHKDTGQEVAWRDGDGLRADGGGSTGGGVSGFNPRPSWQKGLDINTVNPGALNGRIVPDVAANAAGSTGYFIVAPDANSGDQAAGLISGGTSAATPLFASLLVRIQQTGKVLGFLAPKLYASSPSSGGEPVGSVAFRDITQGNNATGSAPGYSAKKGFDALTGWGTPIGEDLLNKLP